MSERDYNFARLPAGWIRNEHLKHFVGGSNLGLSVTALKIYIAILCATRSDNSPPGPGRARLSYTHLEDHAGVARPMISDALAFLEPWVRTERSKSGNVYEIVGFTTEPGQWVKLPAAHLIRGKALQAFSSRAPVSLAALKLYLYLLERRERKSVYARASYKKIRERTGIYQNDIPRAHTALGGADLIRCYPAARVGQPENPGYNLYRIVGLQVSGKDSQDPVLASLVR